MEASGARVAEQPLHLALLEHPEPARDFERAIGDRNAEGSLGFQLRKNFPDSREARALASGLYE